MFRWTQWGSVQDDLDSQLTHNIVTESDVGHGRSQSSWSGGALTSSPNRCMPHRSMQRLSCITSYHPTEISVQTGALQVYTGLPSQSFERDHVQPRIGRLNWANRVKSATFLGTKLSNLLWFHFVTRKWHSWSEQKGALNLPFISKQNIYYMPNHKKRQTGTVIIKSDVLLGIETSNHSAVTKAGSWPKDQIFNTQYFHSLGTNRSVRHSGLAAADAQALKGTILSSKSDLEC